MSMPQPKTPRNRPPHPQPQPQSLRRTLTDTVAPSAIDAFGSTQSSRAVDTAAATYPTRPEIPTKPDVNDSAMLVGLSIWTARQHSHDIDGVTAASEVSHRSYPTVLADTLRRHAEAGDPTCRLVLHWLRGKGILETVAGRSRKGAI